MPAHGAHQERPVDLIEEAVRGLAILMVLLFHFVSTVPPSNWVERAIVDVTNYGSYGVHLLFVLSGFLITGILYDTRNAPHFSATSHQAFPPHLPALLWCAGALLLRGPADPAAAGADAGLFWWVAKLGRGSTPSTSTSPSTGDWSFSYLDHFWSLAVEEHFYFFWPLVVFALARRPEALIAVSLVTTLASGMDHPTCSPTIDPIRRALGIAPPTRLRGAPARPQADAAHQPCGA